MIKRTSISFVWVLFLSACGIGRAFGQPLSFEQLDANRDGVATKAELADALAGRPADPDKVLGMLDTNGDGQLSREEFDARPKRMQRWM